MQFCTVPVSNFSIESNSGFFRGIDTDYGYLLSANPDPRVRSEFKHPQPWLYGSFMVLVNYIIITALFTGEEGGEGGGQGGA